ncbi:MFS transporter, partial [Paracoccus sp. PXZ]
AVAHANDHVDSTRFVQVSGGLLILYGIGTMFGPLLAASLMQWRGAHGIFLTLAGCSALLALYATLRLYRGKPVPVETQDDFSAISIARTQTPETLSLDCQSALKSAPLSASKRDPSGDVVSRPVAA